MEAVKQEAPASPQDNEDDGDEAAAASSPRDSPATSPGGGSPRGSQQHSPPVTLPARSRSCSPADSPQPPARLVDLADDKDGGGKESDKDRPAGDAVGADRGRAGTTATSAAAAAGGPRLRLNPSLATDPAAGAAALPSGGARRDFLAALPAFHSA
ncbi:uncharacterized protein LOC127749197, partial [Frankliniella occidentalis]|uniref:Uncharacterized protein LOC127749197 n=1 Tax=Frankliniella occidentalis TaxID=133901 RepID=A0A9C6WX21_FRAOC